MHDSQKLSGPDVPRIRWNPFLSELKCHQYGGKESFNTVFCDQPCNFAVFVALLDQFDGPTTVLMALLEDVELAHVRKLQTAQNRAI